jgi:hypothetical protein
VNDSIFIRTPFPPAGDPHTRTAGIVAKVENGLDNKTSKYKMPGKSSTKNQLNHQYAQTNSLNHHTLYIIGDSTQVVPPPHSFTPTKTSKKEHEQKSQRPKQQP